MGIWETEHHTMCQEVSTWKLSIFPKSTFLRDRLSPRTHTPEYKSLAGSGFSIPSRLFPIPGPGTWTESSQKKGKMARKFLKKCSSSIAKRELQIKTTFWFSSYSIQNKKKQATTNTGEGMGKGTVEICEENSQKDKRKSIIWASCTTAWHVPKGLHMFTAALFTMARK